MTLILHRNVLGEPVRPAVTDRRRRRLSSVVGRHADRARPHIVSVHRLGQAIAPCDDTVVLAKERRSVLVGAQDVVVITYLPLGGAAGGAGGQSKGKEIGMAVAAIALLVVAPYAVSFLGPTFAATAGATASLTFAGKLLAA